MAKRSHKRLCIVCRERPAALPDRNRVGVLKRICRECHADRLREDLARVVSSSTGAAVLTRRRYIVDVEARDESSFARAIDDALTMFADEAPTFLNTCGSLAVNGWTYTIRVEALAAVARPSQEGQ